MRRRPFAHKRLMMVATLVLTVAAADRVASLLELEDVRWFRKLLAAAPAIALIGYDAVRLRRIPLLSCTLLAVVWMVIWLFVSDLFFMHPAGEAVMRVLTHVFVW